MPCHKLKYSLIALFIMLNISNQSWADQKDFDRFLVAKDISDTCRKRLFNDGKSELLYQVGTSPEIVCNCSGEFVAKEMTWDEFNYIKNNNKYPQSVFDKMTSSMHNCAIVTSSEN